MAKFPSEVEETVVVPATPARTYEFLWDVLGSSFCIPGIDRCEAAGDDTYRFIYKSRSTGPVSMVVQYTARYEGNGTDRITFESFGAEGDNTDVRGTIRLEPYGPGTRVVMKQMISPDTPVPRLLQSLIRSFVEAETATAVREYLANVRGELER